MSDPIKVYKPKIIDTKKAEEPLSEEDKAVQQRREDIDNTVKAMPKEYGGRPEDKGLEPTRYGDWEFKGRCSDF